METIRIRKTIAILLAILFTLTVTVNAVSAISPRPEPPSIQTHTVLSKSSAFTTVNTNNQKCVEKAPLIAFKSKNGLMTTRVNIIGLVLD